MYYARRAALRLDQQRISLKRQHKSLLADLAKSTGRVPAAEFTERIEGLRRALRQSMTENLEISRKMTKRMHMLNFGSMGDAILAQKRISSVYSNIMKTLNELDKRAAQ